MSRAIKKRGKEIISKMKQRWLKAISLQVPIEKKHNIAVHSMYIVYEQFENTKIISYFEGTNNISASCKCV